MLLTALLRFKFLPTRDDMVPEVHDLLSISISEVLSITMQQINCLHECYWTSSFGFVGINCLHVT